MQTIILNLERGGNIGNNNLMFVTHLLACKVYSSV